VRELVADEEIRALLGRVGELPALPRTYDRMAEVLDNPSAGPQQIADALSSCITICAKILRLANSAICGGRRQVTSVAHAISLIGTETIKGLVLTNTLAAQHAIPALVQQRLEDLQEHSLLVARVAQEIAGADPVARRDAFSAGMLHDFGRLVLAQELPQLVDARTAVLRQSAAGPVSEAFHARIGGYLLGMWGLPLAVIDAVARHHDPPTAGCPLVTEAVRVAEDLVAEVVADDRASTAQVEAVMGLARERGRALGEAQGVAA
jgi:HD-like signal output (HDOD) protein